MGIDENLSVSEKLDALDELGFINHPGKESSAMPTYHQYLESSKGSPLQDIWAYQPHTKGVLYNSDECIDEDVKWLTSQGSKERLGYPTQKPQGLLLRIIQSSCPENGIVLDPFCGCGTAVHASQLLKRPWIGIDITHLAIGLIERRLKDAFPNITFRVHGTPTDIDGARNLALRDKYEFQYWACDLVNAIPAQNKKKGADFGIDGILYFQDEKSKAKKIIVSVKGGENITRNMMADLKNSVDRENAQIGLFVTLNPPTDPMAKEALSAGYYESPIGKSYPKIQILTIEDLLSGNKSPQYPDLARGGLSFRKSQVEIDNSNQPGLFK